MPASRLIRATVHWSGLGEEGTVSWWIGGLTTVPTAETLLAYVQDAHNHGSSDTVPGCWEDISGYLAQAQAIDGASAYYYPGGGGPAEVQAHDDWHHQGQGTTDKQHPLQCSVVATILTGFSGRRHRGRQYFPYVYGGLDAQSQLSQGLCDNIANMAVNCAAAWQESARRFFGDGCRFGVYSRAGDFFTQANAIKIDSRVDIQRRRASSQQALRNTTRQFVVPTS